MAKVAVAARGPIGEEAARRQAMAAHRVEMHEKLATLTLHSTVDEISSYISLTPGGSAERPYEFLHLHTTICLATAPENRLPHAAGPDPDTVPDHVNRTSRATRIRPINAGYGKSYRPMTIFVRIGLFVDLCRILHAAKFLNFATLRD